MGSPCGPTALKGSNACGVERGKKRGAEQVYKGFNQRGGEVAETGENPRGKISLRVFLKEGIREPLENSANIFGFNWSSWGREIGTLEGGEIPSEKREHISLARTQGSSLSRSSLPLPGQR